MARLWQCGFELQSVTAGVEFDSNSGTPTIDTTTVRSGSASMRINGAAISKFITHQYLGAGVATNRFFRFYIYIATASNTASAAMALFRDGTNGNGASIRINTDNTLELWDEQGSAQRGSDSPALNTNTWYRLELQYNRSSGSAAAYINGIQFASGATTANLDMNVIRLGMVDTATCDFYFDDLAVNDSSGSNQVELPGSGKIIHLKPNAAGDVNGFLAQVGGTAGAANNFTRVNEVTPDDATSYNGSAVLNAEDLFECSNASLDPNNKINVVAIGARMADLVGADATAAFKLEIEKISGGTKTQSVAIAPNSASWLTNAAAAPKNYPLVTYTDPDGAAWTNITIDTMQIGYAQTATNIQTIAISNVWASIDYTPQVYGRFTNAFRNVSVGNGMSRSEGAT